MFWALLVTDLINLIYHTVWWKKLKLLGIFFPIGASAKSPACPTPSRSSTSRRATSTPTAWTWLNKFIRKSAFLSKGELIVPAVRRLEVFQPCQCCGATRKVLMSKALTRKVLKVLDPQKIGLDWSWQPAAGVGHRPICARCQYLSRIQS